MGFGKDNKGVIIREKPTITLGTLNAATAIKQTSGGVAGSMGEDFRLIKTEVFIYVEGANVDEGPITVGIADENLTVAEIAECLATEGPKDRNENAESEQSHRPVWELVVIENDSAERGGVHQPIEKVLRWTFSAAEGWCWFAYNDSGAQLAGGTIVRIRAKHFGVWLS